MTTRSLIEAWLVLVVLSAGTTILTLIDASASYRLMIGGGVLVLAGLKARVILTLYLGLSRSRFWKQMFDVLLFAFLSIAYLIYVLG